MEKMCKQLRRIWNLASKRRTGTDCIYRWYSTEENIARPEKECVNAEFVRARGIHRYLYGPFTEYELMTKWDVRFLELAKQIASWSKDPSTQVGCVVVGPDREIRSTGFNGLPRGIEDSEERLNNREMKYPLICHAEENAIMHAARIGMSLKECTAYVTWPPCTRCARSLIQAGISNIVYPDNIEIPERWAPDFELSIQIFEEAGIRVRSA